MGRPHKNLIQLTKDERIHLERGCRAGNWKARKVLRARVLLFADINNNEKRTADAEIAVQAGCSKSTVVNVKRRFQSERLGVLEDQPRSGRPKIVDGRVEAQIIAIACSEAPEGRERWTLHLIADKLIEIVDELDNISYGTVGNALKKTNLNLG